ncbi:MAG: B12-binding domain-containing radical SAM protein [Candidatus Uhrbacteria bacterium]
MSLNNPIRILLVSPKTPDSYWKFSGLLGLVGCQAIHAPLALITVAAIMRQTRPECFEFRHIDLNIEPLKHQDIVWADYVFLTGMNIEKGSIRETIERCHQQNRPTVVGGTFAQANPSAPELALAISLVLGEAECLVQELTDDLLRGELKRSYEQPPGVRADITTSPVPAYDLLSVEAYHSMTLQTSRGCPHGCEFCGVTVKDGRRPRYKTPEQVIDELLAIRNTGFQGNVFIVDDNFVGNKAKAKIILQAMVQQDLPFRYYTQVDVSLAKENELMDLMVQAGFQYVFVGLETPNTKALKEAGKNQNLGLTPREICETLRRKGLLVYSGLIVGFDSDGPEIFAAMQEMVNECAIAMAMVGMLMALPRTKLHTRMEHEGRLVDGSDSNQFSCTNIDPRMGRLELIRGFRELIEYFYHPRNFLDRAYRSLKEWQPTKNRRRKVPWREYLAAPKIIWHQGFSSYAIYWWWFMLKVLITSPSKLPRAFAEGAYAHHFHQYTTEVVIPRLREAERSLSES